MTPLDYSRIENNEYPPLDYSGMEPRDNNYPLIHRLDARSFDVPELRDPAVLRSMQAQLQIVNMRINSILTEVAQQIMSNGSANICLDTFLGVKLSPGYGGGGDAVNHLRDRVIEQYDRDNWRVTIKLDCKTKSLDLMLKVKRNEPVLQ